MPLPFRSTLSRLTDVLPIRPRYVSGDGDARAFFAQGEKDGRAVLCLHGFTGTPFEVRPLAEAFAAQGFTVLAPVLAGHASTPEALAATRWTDWQASAAAAMDHLKSVSGARKVAIAGFSMGGLLTVRLARLRADEIAAIAIMASPIRLKQREALFIKAMARLPAPLRRGPLLYFPKRSGPDTNDLDMRARNPGLPCLPAPALASMVELGAVVRGDLPHVHAPALVVHGRQDHVVPFEDSLEIAGTLGSNVIERLWLERSAHLVGIDLDRRQLAAALVKFFSVNLRARTAGPDAPQDAKD